MARYNEDPAERGLFGQGWFCYHGGRERGPLDLDALREALRLLPRAEVLIWHPSLPEWVGLDDPRVGGLFAPAPTRLAEPVGLSALLFSFRGRLGRWRYLRGLCLLLAPGFALARSEPFFSRAGLGTDGAEMLHLALLLPLFWVGSALIAKRLHDLGLSAVHLLWVVPMTSGFGPPVGEPARTLAILAGLVVTVWLLLARGVRAANPYGPDPVEGTASASPIGAAPPRRGLLSVLFVLAAVAAMGTLLVYSDRPFEILPPRPSLCSSPDVLATVHDFIEEKLNPESLRAVTGETEVILQSARTLDANSPARGSTCAVTARI